jgi:serine/threonine protein kinase
MPINPERYKQIDELLSSVLQLEVDERPTFLDKACNGDEDLRKEIEALLASDQKEQGHIEEYPMKMAADLLSGPAVRLGAGKFIDHYKILSLLGSGGMGEVYRASDPRIGRDVAIKILPDHFSKDPDRLRRFEQEARAAGILNHPNILAIHDTGTYNGSPYLVSELLQGEVLQRKLTGQPLPIKKTLDYSLQIAKGLSAAHDKGIVHRDLKPGNIFVTKEGRVKILDFGLAKLTHTEVSANQSDDNVEPLTETGVVLGTVVYMSPEQVSGRKIDHRSDIFAFGAILYEMLYGKRPFSGATQIEIMHAILKTDPSDLSTPNANVPISLERIVRRCLEKDPNDRFQSASDLAFAIESMSTTSGTSVAAYKQKKSIPIAWILCGIFFLAALISAFYGLKRKAPFEIPNSVQRLSIILPENFVLNSSAISPDGQRLAYVTNEMTGFSKLWLRSMDSGHVEEIQGSEDATLPFWSPDSRSVAFFTKNTIKNFSICGGSIETLHKGDIDIPKGGTWNQHGDILFSPRPGAGLYRISARGGEPISITELDD